ncbi:nucleosome-remodeling factor subunit NURF301 isoform X2 [Nilaparvata lugens]|uniref:nucleosome-remodeling factor subunit NURF301 isoform X2 n=1 Tax=Nilaparvata lugens TaxID=108931 RepID=UPI00193D1E77|nr:nucleosome-remodeling factor subunit NURF301 isoform X2 [Nilaparvata lugens]
MSARGTKRRGRPPKTVVMERPRKFQYHLLKKPKYLLNIESRGSETPNSQTSTPTASRASSPIGSESSRRSTRIRGRPKSTRGRGGSYHKRGYNPDAVEEKYSEYHYGSDFGDDSSGKSEHEDDDILRSESESEETGEKEEVLSDSDYSLSSFGTTGETARKQFGSFTKAPSPEPIWLQNREIPILELPKSSDDLLIPKDLVMQALSIYEVLRHFRTLVRLSPFRFEDFCAVLMFEDQSYLLAEIHIMLLKAILREEDAQQTHFGPLDQKDSVNIALFFIDSMTWPEVLRVYIESDKNFDSTVLHILNTCEYPFTDVENRLKVLQFLTDLFLVTNPVREDLIHEGNFQYDDHCRICHRVGDLLCCETCPAVFHLECVEPPLNDVPHEDWQCGLCRAHRQVVGVIDCIPDVEKSGLLSRQEHLGFDRHGRKYWFLTRRIFVEGEDGESWYYSSPIQLDELLTTLDSGEYEAALCREINDFRDEIVRQMELTEKITNQNKGNKKSYLEIENAQILKMQRERAERKIREEEERLERERMEVEERREREESEKREKEKQEVEEMMRKMHEGSGSGGDNIADLAVEGTEVVCSSGNDQTSAAPGSPGDKNSDSDDGKSDDGEEIEGREYKIGKDGKKHVIVTRSKTGSLTPRTFSMDELKRKGGQAGFTKAELDRMSATERKELLAELGEHPTRVTRLKAQQIASGTHYFKLGMENGFKTYVNQYATNISALNKIQRNEERDKKRHLSHKFSLTQASEFKWAGPFHGSRNQLMGTLRQTLLNLESAIQSPFMHVNWPQLRKPWIAAVGSCIQAKDFTRAIIVLQACIKPVVYATVWHEILGHIKLQRITSAEREDRKRIEKKEKKEKEDEEERNRLTYNFVKYTLGLKHQVWKQKGEEYRVHGQWGWLWLSASRNYKLLDCRKCGLRAGPQKYMVQVKDDKGLKIIAADLNTYKVLERKRQRDDLIAQNKDASDIPIDPEETKILEKFNKDGPANNLKVFAAISEFEEIDITKALLNPGRLLYPKVAKKSKLDDFLTRRMQLKALEERMLMLTGANRKPIEKAPNTMPAARDSLVKTEDETRNILGAIGAKINLIKNQYAPLHKMAKDYRCYTRGCSEKDAANCYSPICAQRMRLRRELLILLRKANSTRNHNLKLDNTVKLETIKPENDLINGECKKAVPEISAPVRAPPPVAVTEPIVTTDKLRRVLENKPLNEVLQQQQPLSTISTAVPSTMSSDVPSTMSSDVPSTIMDSFVCNEVEVGTSSSADVEVKSEVIETSEVPDLGDEGRSMDSILTESNDDKTKPVPEIKKEPADCHSIVKSEVKSEGVVKTEPVKSESASERTDGGRSVTTVTTTTTTQHSVRIVDGVIKTVSATETVSSIVTTASGGVVKKVDNTDTKSVLVKCGAGGGGANTTVTAASSVKVASVKVESDSRVYSATCTRGKVYLKKANMAGVGGGDKRKKRAQVKYPHCSTFQTKSKKRNLLILPQHELRKLARLSGRIMVNGFNHLAKINQQAWPYPCSRPLFKTCWLYRTMNLKTLAAACLQLKIIWACLRWDDMQVKPPSSDGKHQVTTDTELMSTEILKHRHLGEFSDRTQYLVRKVVIPLELPKTIREVTSIRSGLRKRKREEAPQSTEPQVTETWVDENKLELWEIKQFGDKLEKAVLAQTQVSSGTRSRVLSASGGSGKAAAVGGGGDTKGAADAKQTPEEVKEKLEQQLKAQRVAHQQKRQLADHAQKATPTTQGHGQVIKIIPSAAQGGGDGQTFKVVTKVAIPPTPTSGAKSTLTSLLTNSTPNKSVIGTRRIFMTKGSDGNTRMVSGTPPNILPKTVAPTVQAATPTQATSIMKLQTTTTQAPAQQHQRVSITKGPDGKIQVKGLMPGQQLVQMPDGKLHVLTTQSTSPTATAAQGQTGRTGAAAPQQVTVVKAPSKAPIIRPANMRPAAPNATAKPPQQLNKTVVIRQQVGGSQLVQKVGAQPGTVVVSGGQIIPGGQIVVSGNSPQVNQLVVNNPSLAQQLASGKATIATINGQQVLIRTAPTPGATAATGTPVLKPAPQQQPTMTAGVKVVKSATGATQVTAATVQSPVKASPAKVVTQPKTVVVASSTTPNANTNANLLQSPAKSASSPVVAAAAVAPSPASQGGGAVQPVGIQGVPSLPSSQPVGVQGVPSLPSSLTPEQEAQLLANQPPGTQIRAITAQVIQTPQGPRIVLQGLTGSNYTPQQLALVQQQVKQQLLRAQAQAGNQGVLGPTKIYLAVQPSVPVTPTTPTPTTPTPAIPAEEAVKPVVDSTTPPAPAQQAVTAPADSSGAVMVNGQVVDTTGATVNVVTTPPSRPLVAATPASGTPTPTPTPTSNQPHNKFVLTPDYIQQTIKSALKQENLNPEIEEKLLQLQRYQEKQMRTDAPVATTMTAPITTTTTMPAPAAPVTTPTKAPPSRKRPAASLASPGDAVAVAAAAAAEPKRKLVKTDVNKDAAKAGSSNVKSRSGKWQEDRRRHQVQTKLQVLLFRHKELLKKDILKKRALLEKELQITIQQELSSELSTRTKADRTKMGAADDAKPPNMVTGSAKRKSQPVQPPLVGGGGGGPGGGRRGAAHAQRHHQAAVSPPSPRGGGGTAAPTSRAKKHEKLLCICRTPYDETKFYVGCDLCNNWFHGDCVGITEEMSKTLTEFVCTECKHARETQELYCLCRQPYDESQFYICCDKCQDWFHGRCVGILQSEADNIDEYVCPNCQRNSSINFANMKNLNTKDFEALKKLIKQLQTHKSAWPFMEPVDPAEAPDYYKVIKEPMDLQTIELRITDRSYKKLSEFIGDMTKIFDNCRYYNPKESPFFKCAESLEAYFVQKVKGLRDKLVDNN